MQIDGHHTATYVAARSAGFRHDEAATIAYAAQYVDDATNDGPILFENSEYLYARIASAHGTVDYHNVIDVANHLAWLPFHFLPGNGGLGATEEPEGGELAKLVCVQDSHVARDMVRAAMRDRGSPRELHRLGIAMHVYADTFTHQGFIGAICEANRVTDRRSSDPRYDVRIERETIREIASTLWRRTKAWWALLVMSVLQAARERKWPTTFWRDFRAKTPLGHAAADTFPDQPYLDWSYTDWQGRRVERSNPRHFAEAVDLMTRVMRAWRAGDAALATASHAGLDPADAQLVDRLFCEFDDADGRQRHRRWLQVIERGEFSFGPASLRYDGKGVGSWKHAALGATKFRDSGLERYRYSPAFLSSDWKHFHDALQAHRNAVVHDILPAYGICAA